MQEQNLQQNLKQNEEEEPLTEKIERETSRLDPDPLTKLKKRMNKLYAWIWVLLGLSALLFLILVIFK